MASSRSHDFHRRSFNDGRHPFKTPEEKAREAGRKVSDFRDHEAWCLEPRDHAGTCEQAMLSSK